MDDPFAFFFLVDTKVFKIDRETLKVTQLFRVMSRVSQSCVVQTKL